MISKKIQKAFNEQINAEAYSAYLYLSMSAALEEMDLPGFGNWMRIQAQEEMTHVMKFYHHIIERGGKVEMMPIEGPPNEWDGPMAIFKQAYEHEQKVTSLINKLMDMALAESDHASSMFLQWFVTEQVEEEASADAIVKKLKMVEAGKGQGGLYMLDKEMAQRTFTPPAAEGE